MPRWPADTDLAALVADRIYPDTVPEECPLPALAFVRTGGEKFYGLDDSLHAKSASAACRLLGRNAHCGQRNRRRRDRSAGRRRSSAGHAGRRLRRIGR